jgi:hypothetical protein
MHRNMEKNTKISETEKGMVYGYKTYRNKIMIRNKKE